MLSQSHHANYNNEEEVVDFVLEARESASLDIRYTTIRDGAPLEMDRDLHFQEHWEIMMREFPAIVDGFVGNIIKDSHPSLVHFLVTDTLYVWPSTVAEKYNLINVSFWTQPALVFSLLYHLDLLKQNGHFPCKDDVKEDITYVPGVESINTRDLMLFLKEAAVGSVITKALSMAFEGVKKADFILINTVEELESETLSVLNKYHPTYAIGDRGLIIRWCNQIRVLSNPAVGGFMTHNGWNSTVESVWCGVPMICNPVAHDQLSNRKLVADDWKVGIRLCDEPLSAGRDQQVAEKIKELMSDEDNWNR